MSEHIPDHISMPVTGTIVIVISIIVAVLALGGWALNMQAADARVFRVQTNKSILEIAKDQIRQAGKIENLEGDVQELKTEQKAIRLSLIHK